jgi:serine/threonine protein kinase
VRLFVDEARLAAQLSHPNVVSVYDAGHEHGEYFFVMEFVHGRDLRALITQLERKRRVVSIDEALTIGVGICAGLHHAHERSDETGRPLGIVHRDVSPSNVLCSYEGAVKLADFGIAKATQAATKEPGTDALRGKLSYMSPEQLAGEPLDRRSDLYSLSVVLYELTTGELPYGPANNEFMAVKRALGELPPRPPSSLRPGYPRELERIVLRGLARDRARRYATARELQLDLEAFARAGQLALSPLTLTHLMEELFAVDLSAWRAAEQRGQPLGQHVTASGTHSLGPSHLLPGQTVVLSPGAGQPMRSPASPAAARRRWAAIAVPLCGAIPLLLAARPNRAQKEPAALVAPAQPRQPVTEALPMMDPPASVPTLSPAAARPLVRAPEADKEPTDPRPRNRRVKHAKQSRAWDPDAPVLPR